jgi:hypothetical protein
MNLTGSVNDNRTVNLKANNTRAATTYRNATFSGEQLTGFTKVWQNLTITQLQATYDARSIQGGGSSTEYLRARNQTADNKKLAMRFTTVDKVNLTGVWMYYSLGGSSIPFTINVTATDLKTPSGSSSIGGGSLSTTGGVEGWYYVPLSSPVTLTRGNYYWLIVDASALSPGSFDWYYIRDQGGEDGIYGSAYRTAIGWFDETQMISASWVPAYFNLMLVLKVIAVDDSLNIRKYSSPQQVNMYLNSTGNPVTANSSRISNVFSTFVVCTNTSVTFTIRWDARFEKTQTGIATTTFRAGNGLTFWNVTFTSGAMPTRLYTLYNRTLRVFTVPAYWAIQPSNVSNTGVVTSFTASFVPGSGYVFIVQGGNPNVDPWVDTWLIKAKSTYKVTAMLPSQVVAGLPLTLNVSTKPYSPSWCNVSFYNPLGAPVYSRNVSIPLLSALVTLKLNETGLHTLFLFDRWTGHNEASLNSTLTVNALPPASNITVTGRTSPVIGNTATLRFKFYNNSLGMGNTWIQPQAISVNGTPTTNFGYDVPSGVTSLYMDTASVGWRTGNNTIVVSVKNGVFNATKQTWIMVQKPLCNVTVDSINSPILGNPATAQFRFLNNTAGGAPMPPLLVRINGTIASFTYASGVTTVSWSTAGGWRSGLNHVNITAISGVFFNSTVYAFTIIAPNATLVLSATLYYATYGDSISVGFTFMNMTGGTPHPFPSLITLYRNGTSVTPTDLGGGSYTYVLNTRYFSQAGSYHVNFTAHYGTYTATNITAVALSKILMSLSIQTPQTSVTIGSSLSVSAALTYGNGTSAPDGFGVQFDFIVTYTNGSVLTISKTAVINNGVASSSLLAASDMKSINVNATYAGNGITTSASDLKQNIQVVAPQGLSLMMIALIGGGGGALVVALVGILKYRGRRKRTEVTKTKALVQTASLAQLIVVHLASGRALYSRSIGSEEGADPNLISGFLSANQSIITEVFKKQPGAGLKFADYGEYKVVSNVGNYIMATLFCTETAGEELQGILRSFTEKFEKKYASVLQSWDGNMSAFKDADNIADDVFSLPLCSPYMLLDTQIAKLSRDERAAVHSARILSGERGVFFMPRVVDFLLTKQGLKRGKAMDVINSLMKKGVFRQLTIEQAAQVVKSTTEQAGNQP